jgi:hypothetical protein
MTPRQLLTVIGLLVILVSMTVFVTVTMNDKSDNDGSLETLPSASTRVVKLRSTTRSEIILRLQEILRTREEAYRSRSSELLASIYSGDCPCLASDGNAIEDLLRRRRIWDGVRTSIEVRGITKFNEHVWTIVGLFRSETLYIRTEDGRLVGKEPGGTDLLRFTLVKLQDEPDWLLGLVSVLQGP